MLIFINWLFIDDLLLLAKYTSVVKCCVVWKHHNDTIISLDTGEWQNNTFQGEWQFGVKKVFFSPSRVKGVKWTFIDCWFHGTVHSADPLLQWMHAHRMTEQTEAGESERSHRHLHVCQGYCRLNCRSVKCHRERHTVTSVTLTVVIVRYHILIHRERVQVNVICLFYKELCCCHRVNERRTSLVNLDHSSPV